MEEPPGSAKLIDLGDHSNEQNTNSDATGTRDKEVIKNSSNDNTRAKEKLSNSVDILNLDGDRQKEHNKLNDSIMSNLTSIMNTSYVVNDYTEPVL